MMTGGNDGSEVVRTWSDSSCGTGDYLLQTADGAIRKIRMTDSPPFVTRKVGGKIPSDKFHVR